MNPPSTSTTLPSVSTSHTSDPPSMHNPAAMPRISSVNSNFTGSNTTSSQIPWAQLAQQQQQSDSTSQSIPRTTPLNAPPMQGFPPFPPGAQRLLAPPTWSDNELSSNARNINTVITPADEAKMVLALATATRIEQNYKLALDGLRGVIFLSSTVCL